MPEALRRHDELITAAVVAAGGQDFKNTGDVREVVDRARRTGLELLLLPTPRSYFRCLFSPRSPRNDRAP
jgi:hypothetical protein